ncbi:MAG: molybdopterin-guanine dinucleotide biosynthesis protein MobB [Desulfitibacter sp. BRH_c19]|nr:MAG: molybdopterin-guanine dinucleotide biosynthesis protein MobB [Desulfitibacter sp. BRH_c19]
MAKMISLVGRSNVGKTTHLEKVLREIKSRGYKVATIKHDVHGFDIDVPGKDTWKHAQAGADTVVISSPNKIAIIEKLSEEKTLDEIAEKLQNVDIIITEGYKRANKPKIEIVRMERGTEPLCDAKELLALVTDCDIDMDVPKFSFEDVSALVDLIEKKFIR